MITQTTKTTCQCGRGAETAVAKVTIHARARVKGQRVKYIQGHNARVPVASKSAERVRVFQTEDGVTVTSIFSVSPKVGE
jgi:hypothetical protein